VSHLVASDEGTLQIVTSKTPRSWCVNGVKPSSGPDVREDDAETRREAVNLRTPSVGPQILIR
jgi:hypothetical protein